jgi:hypothetical protein
MEYQNTKSFNLDFYPTAEKTEVRTEGELNVVSPEKRQAPTVNLELQNRLGGLRNGGQLIAEGRRSTWEMMRDLFGVAGAAGTVKDIREWGNDYRNWMLNNDKQDSQYQERQNTSGSPYRNNPNQYQQPGQSGTVVCDQYGNCQFRSNGSYGQ